MSNSRKPLDGTAFACIVLLCTLWGGQQIFLKLTAENLTPAMHIGLRGCIGCVLLALYMRHQKISLALWRGPWVAGCIVGLLFGAEWWMIGEGLARTTASHMVVFLYTTPIFTALGLHYWVPEERLSWLQWFGVMTCFTGIAVAFLGGSDQPHFNLTTILGDLLGLGAGLLWAATTVIIRCTELAKIPPAQTTFYQLSFASVGILVVCALTGQAGVIWTPFVISSILIQGVVIAFMSLLIWFWLLRHYLASRVSIFTFLTPLMGVTFGVWILDDPLHPEFVWGAVMVLSGMVLVNIPKKKQQAV